MLAPFGHPARVIPYLGYRSPTRLVLIVRAVRGRDPNFAARGRWRAMRTLLEQFVSHEVPGLTVTLELRSPAGQTLIHRQVSDREGYARFDIALDPQWQLPAHPAWETASLRWRNRHGQQEALAHVLAPGRDGRLAVISDIDDTIIETGITGGVRAVARNWRRLLAELPGQRTAVPGSDVLFDALSGGAVADHDASRTGERLVATRRPFFYVSSSPWNLFAYLVAFMRTRNLPLGPLLLRDWGLNRETFGHHSHGAHKVALIAALCEFFPDMRFALIGDDTQGDLPAYAAAVAAHPGRIAAIFVRTANPALDPPEEVAREAIAAAGVPLWLGPSYAVGDDFLLAAGFTPHGETAAIVEAVEKAA